MKSFLTRQLRRSHYTKNEVCYASECIYRCDKQAQTYTNPWTERRFKSNLTEHSNWIPKFHCGLWWRQRMPRSTVEPLYLDNFTFMSACPVLECFISSWTHSWRHNIKSSTQNLCPVRNRHSDGTWWNMPPRIETIKFCRW